MEEKRQSTRRVSRFHATASQQPCEGIHPSPGSLIIPSHLWATTLTGLRDRSAGWRESAAIWAGQVSGSAWTAESVHFHHDLCDDHAGSLSIELSEGAKFRLYQDLGGRGQRLVALIHTHPHDWVDLSEIDQANQLSSRLGFWSLVVPWYAREPWVLEAIGVHVRGALGWHRIDVGDVARHIRFV
jgi:proteasome lid subunit RPN8/RPN11